MGDKNNFKQKQPNKIKKIVSSQNSKLRRFQKTLIAGTIVGASLIGAGALVYNNWPSIFTRPSSGIEQKVDVSFEQARNNLSSRQEYIDQLFKRKDRVGVEGWESFAGFVYVTNPAEYDRMMKEKGAVDERIPEYSPSSSKGLIRFIGTPFLGQREVPLTSYFFNDVFNYCLTEDELLSCLDNESFHAFMFHKGKAHIKTDLPDKNPPNQLVFDLMSELYSFEKQFFFIEARKRRVRKEFVELILPPAKVLYDKLIELTRQEDRDGAFARAIKRALESRPTLPYFTGEKIFFEDAVENPELRQKYLTQRAAIFISALEQEHNTKLVGQIIYDPEYRKLDDFCREVIEIYSNDSRKLAYFRDYLKSNQDHRIGDKELHLGKTILPTANFAQGETSDIYLPKEFFDPELIASEDELLSILDHELNHAIIGNKGIPIKQYMRIKHGLDNTLDATNLNDNLSLACHEVIAYHFQLDLIENGTRRVRLIFRQRSINSYNREYQIVKSFADRNDDSFDSRFANALIDSLTYHPEPKRN